MEFATGALGTLLPKLGQLLQDEYYLQKSAKKNIKSLTDELRSIQAALRSVGEVPPEQLSELVRIWARDARELSYDMEDIVDAFLVRVQGPEPPGKKTSKRFIKKMMDFVNKARTRHGIGQEIKDIKDRVKEVAERRDRYKVDSIPPAKTSLVDPRIPYLYTKAADLVGINGAREELITRLTKGDDVCTQQKIISIVGLGGLGKTTLAKAVYDMLKGQFYCTAFIPVGRNPDTKRVLRDILIDLDNRYMSPSFSTLDERQLINEFHVFLEKKRYLIVIDDVWNTESWGIIRLALVENNSRSRIIITTRILEVAKKADDVYQLPPLSDDNSRKLFFARIFGGESKFSVHQPDEVSDKILKKCGGIPLAIITMASLLVDKPSEEWSEVHRSIGFGNKQNNQVENTKNIISFSYYDLPPHLRTCLLFLSVFPEDYFIEKSHLILMWMAEGFVHEEQGISSFKIGEGYFNELVNRSMIQLVEIGEWYNNVYGCRIHDMVLDLICSISSEENFVTILSHNEGASSSRYGKVRRLALQSNRTLEAHMDIQQVRSFSSFQYDIGKGIPLSSFKLVRMLNIVGIYKFHHVEHIRNLLHLRYLRVSLVDVESLEEIETLKFLQTLDIGGSVSRKLLASVGHLTQLVCLRFGSSVCTVPDGIGKLTSLEELGINYSNAFDEEPLLRRFMKELGSLRKLRVLCVSMYNPWTDVRAVEMDMVESLRNLEKMEQLFLYCRDVSADTARWEAAGFLLPLPLRRLCLYGITFSRFPSFCINRSRLPNLSHLSLEVDDIDEQDLRILGALPELQSLCLDVMQSTMELVCDSTSTDATTGNGYLFQKLRHCSMSYRDVRFLPSKGSVSFPRGHVHASMGFSFERADVSNGKDVAPTLMPSAQELVLSRLSVRGFKDGSVDNGCGSLALEYFASLQNVRVRVDCRDASAAEVEEVEAALHRAAELHPNSPTLEIQRMY